MTPSTDPDADLVTACQSAGDEAFEEAFEALFRKYKDRVYGIAYRITGNAVDAMDAVQDSFALLFRKIGGFRFDALFSTWLFRLVVNCSIDLVRSRTGRPGSLEADGMTADSPEPLDVACSQELGEVVQAAIQRLSPKLRAVLALRYLEGMSYEELRVALELSMGTVKSRLARAHLALEQVLRGTPALRGLQDGHVA